MEWLVEDLLGQAVQHSDVQRMLDDVVAVINGQDERVDDPIGTAVDPRVPGLSQTLARLRLTIAPVPGEIELLEGDVVRGPSRRELHPLVRQQHKFVGYHHSIDRDFRNRVGGVTDRDVPRL